MKIQDILAISGEPGLYKYVASSRNGIIAESLVNGARKNFSGTHSRVSSLAEISIFTDDEDVALTQVLGDLYAYTTTATDNRVLKLSPDDPDQAPETVIDGLPKGTNHNRRTTTSQKILS